MVYNGKLLKMDDLGVPLFLETPIYPVNNFDKTCGVLLEPPVTGQQLRPSGQIRDLIPSFLPQESCWGPGPKVGFE